MSQREFLAWRQFHALYPFDDHHRYHRPAALVAHLGMQSKTELPALLHWLQPEPTTVDLSDADLAVMKAFGFSKKGP